MAQRGRPKQDVSLGQIAKYNHYSYSILGRNFTYNPSAISYDTYQEMRNYSTITGALGIVKHPISSIDWYIEGSDERKKEFVEYVFKTFFPEFINDLLMAFDFGWSGFEKVWENTEFKGEARVGLKKLVPLSCHNTHISITDTGDFNGLHQQNNTGQDVFIPAEKSFIYTHQKEYGNLYGIPRTRGAYTPWYITRYVLEFCNVFFEKYANPMLVGYAPQVKQRVNGKDVDAIDHMLQLLKSMQSASSAVLPHTGGKRDELRYFIDVLESKRTGGDFLGYLNWLKTEMFTGALVPGLSFSVGEKGSYALFEEQASMFAQEVDGIITTIKHAIDVNLIKPLIELNFGGGDDDTQWAYQSLAKRDKELTRQIMLALIQQGRVEVAVQFLKDALGMPAKETGEIVKSLKADPQKDPLKENKNSTGNMENARFMRKPNDLEKHVNFEKIKERFDTSEKDIQEQLTPILEKQKAAILASIAAAIANKRIGDIQNIGLTHKGEYVNKVVELSRGIFEAGVEDVAEEMELENTSIPQEARNYINAQAKNIGKKHLNDLEFIVVSGALMGLSKDVSEKQVVSEATKAWDKYVGESLPASATMLTQKYYNDGREWAAEENGLKFAEWSAVLDDKTCEYCAGRDGMVIDVSNPDFAEFSPGNTHANCRCIWVYLDGFKGEANWKSPSATAQEKYYMFGRCSHG